MAVHCATGEMHKLRKLPPKPHLSQQDKDALVAFMRTLSDSTLQADPRLASPFRKAGAQTPGAAP